MRSRWLTRCAEFLAAAEHHRGRGAQAERMRDAVHFHPVVAGALQARDLAANFVVQNFRAAAGNGIAAPHPSGAESCRAR